MRIAHEKSAPQFAYFSHSMAFFSFYCTHCAQIGHEFSVLFEQPPHYRAYILGLHVLTILAFVDIARIFYTVSKQQH